MTTSGASAGEILHPRQGSRDTGHFGPAHDVVELEAAETLGMPRDHLPEDPRVRASSSRRASDQAQVRADRERAMVSSQ
jgi:hypothetical protein